MKTRNGFVSNSSSSSFVVLLPDDFDINDKNETMKKGVIELFHELLQHGQIWQEGNYAAYQVLEEILDPYIIAGIDGPSDAGQIVLADKNKIKGILKRKHAMVL